MCHTHYRAIARIIIEVTDEYGVAYNRGTLPGMVRSHFVFLRKMGRAPAAAAEPPVVLPVPAAVPLES